MRRSVLVTGAGSGIGAASAVHLAGLGFHVVAAVHRPEGVDGMRAAARSAGVEVEPIVLDVADEAQRVEALADRELYGLVNNAGYFNAGAVEDVSVDEARRQLETMVVGPMRLAQLALPAMRAAGEGRIVNVSSALARFSGGLSGWYQAAKQALEAVSDALRIEVAGDGVEVVLVRPGAVETPIWDKAARDLRRRRPTSVHAPAYDRFLSFVDSGRGRKHPPEAVAELLGGILTSGRPRSHYDVGRDSTALALLDTVLPTGVRDRLLRTALDR